MSRPVDRANVSESNNNKDGSCPMKHHTVATETAMGRIKWVESDLCDDWTLTSHAIGLMEIWSQTA